MTTPFFRWTHMMIFTFMLCGSLLIAACNTNSPGSGTPQSTAGSSSNTQSNPANISGALFGGNYLLVAQEATLGRKLAIVRRFYGISANGLSTQGKPTDFPAAQDAQYMAGGRTLLVSFDNEQWGGIAAGNLDSMWTSTLSKVNQAAIQYHLKAIYVSFEHEVDLALGKGVGTAQDFISAWHHIYQLAANQHLNWQNGGRLHWVLIFDQEAFSRSNRATQLWPGKDTVDILGDDVYTTTNCTATRALGQATKPSQLLDPPLRWAASNAPNIPLFIPEWSMPGQDAAARPSYIDAMKNYIINHPEIQAEMFFDAHGNKLCDFSIDGDQASLSALAAMGKDPHFQAQLS